MNGIQLIRTADVSPDLLESLVPGLTRAFGSVCRVRPESVSFGVSPDAARNQYFSTAILQSMLNFDGLPGRLLAVTGVDLFVPVLTFVFGEAQVPGRCAVVSIHRLREEFYGLPANESMLGERLLKEALHELGHTYGLLHCDAWECVMSSSHGVERLDVKGSNFCPSCAQQIPTPDLRRRLLRWAHGSY